MDYCVLKEQIRKKLHKMLPEKYSKHALTCFSVMEKFKKREVLKLEAPVNADGSVEAGIYLDKVYEYYLKGFRLEDTLKYTMKLLLDAMEYNATVDQSKILMTLVETETSKDLLKQCPSRPFHGLSILYRIYVEPKRNDWVYSCFITEKMAFLLGMDERELYENAFRNTRRIYMPEIQSIGEHAYEMITTSFIDAEMEENMPESVKEDDSMYVIRNKEGYSGAVYLVYADVIEEAARRAKKDLYLLPSSIYEMYVIPVRGKEDYNALKAESNAEGLCPEEKLTNQVYYYNRENKSLHLFQMTAE